MCWVSARVLFCLIKAIKLSIKNNLKIFQIALFWLENSFVSYFVFSLNKNVFDFLQQDEKFKDSSHQFVPSEWWSPQLSQLYFSCPIRLMLSCISQMDFNLLIVP